jgi:hypothetical protein
VEVSTFLFLYRSTLAFVRNKVSAEGHYWYFAFPKPPIVGNQFDYPKTMDCPTDEIVAEDDCYFTVPSTPSGQDLAENIRTTDDSPKSMEDTE